MATTTSTPGGVPGQVLHVLAFLSGVVLAVVGVAAPSLSDSVSIAFTTAGAAVIAGVSLAVAIHAAAHAFASKL